MSAASRTQPMDGVMLWIALAFWTLLTGFFVARDPISRLLMAHGFVDSAPVPPDIGDWRHLDQDRLATLSKPLQLPAGDEAVEALLEDALIRRRSSEAPALRAAVAEQSLREFARGCAAEWPDPFEAERNAARVPLRLSLTRDNELLGAAAVPQFVNTDERPDGTDAADEFVRGWMRNLYFATLLRSGEALRVGVGAVPVGGQLRIVAVVAELFVIFDDALPVRAGEGETIKVRGRNVGAQDVEFFWMYPGGQVFESLTPKWDGDAFEFSITFDRGPGPYALKAARGSHQSAPRPILVE